MGRIETASASRAESSRSGESVLHLNEGTVYDLLLRLQQQGWITSEWGASENKRKERFYSITKKGLKQFAVQTVNESAFRE